MQIGNEQGNPPWVLDARSSFPKIYFTHVFSQGHCLTVHRSPVWWVGVRPQPVPCYLVSWSAEEGVLS